MQMMMMEEVSTNNMLSFNRNVKLLKEVWDGLDFVMEMFDVPRFPRTVSTAATQRRQYIVNSRDEAMTYFEAALYEDCYMNAYLNYDAMIKIKGITPDYNKPIPNHIMIDLDREPFNSDEELAAALADTLRNIKANITGISGECPPIIASGSGGYHIHVPIPGLIIPLQDMPEFEAFKDDPDLANKFLRFSERRLSNGKADHNHNPSIKSCMFRVPGTINSKTKATVKIVKGLEYAFHRITEEQSLPTGDDYYLDTVASKPTTKFLNDFYAYLVQQQINDNITKSDRRLLLRRRSLLDGKGGPIGQPLGMMWWIDKLLSMGVEDGRKNLLYWVLAPYLVTIRKMDHDKAAQILEAWLDKCDDVRRLEPGWTYFRYRIRHCLDVAESKERLPIRFRTFQEYYPDVYGRLLGRQ